MKRFASETRVDELFCPRHRQPIRGICVDKHCSQKHRYICALCVANHRYDQTEYLDEVLNWDYISKFKYMKMVDALRDREAKRKHKMSELEKTVNTSFQSFADSLALMIDNKRRELLAFLKDQTSSEMNQESLFTNKLLGLKKKNEKMFREFNTENFIRESLNPYIDSYYEVKTLEGRFNEILKQPLMNLLPFSDACLKAQQDLCEEIPKHADQFFKRNDFHRFKKLMLSYPKFTLDEDHIKISSLQCVKNIKEEMGGCAEEFDLLASESPGRDDEMSFERLTFIHFDETNELIFTQSAAKNLVILNGVDQKMKWFSCPINDTITSALFCNDMNTFYFGTENGAVCQLELETKNTQKLYEFGTKVTGIVATTTCLTVASDRMLLFLDPRQDPSLFRTYDLIYQIASIVYISSKDMFVIGFNNGKLSFWACEEKMELSSKLLPCSGISSIHVSENEKIMYSCSEDGYVGLWKSRNRSFDLFKVIKISSPLLPPDLLLLCSHDLLISKEDWLLRVFRMSDGKQLKKIHVKVYQDFKMLYDRKRAVLNIFKNEY